VIGLIILVVGIIYFMLLVWATRASYRWAKGKGFSKVRRYATAFGGFLVVYLPVFWDAIPTFVANRYFCVTEAGFTVFTTIEQWKAANPGVAERLTWRQMSSHEVLPDGTWRYLLNERMTWEIKKRRPIPFISTTLYEDLIRDQKTGEILAKRVGVGSGYPNPMVGGNDWRGVKSWLEIGRCSPMLIEFGRFQTAAKQMGEKR
jgi:hypothetical protein